MAKIKQIILLIIIFVFGIFIYFYKLSEIPNGMYIDEVMPAYNAYSILHTYKDEYGKFMPLVFRFYGSYNPPLYTYLTIFPIMIWGLNNFSARFISVLFGLFSSFVLFVFLSKLKLKSNLTKYFALVISLISPWILLYSRVGYEVSLGYFLFISGVVTFYFSINKPKYFSYAFIFLSLSTYAAYTERFLVPLFIILFSIFFYSKIKNKYFMYGVLLSIVLQIPNFYLLTTDAFFTKADLFFNQTGGLIREFLSRYFTYFSPRSLFFLPDPDLQRSLPALSVFYPWYLILYIFGIYQLMMIKMKNKMLFYFLLILLVINPIPSSLTKDPFSTHRALPVFFPLTIIMSFGLDKILSLFDKRIVIKKIVIMILSILIYMSLFSLWRSYFTFLAKERARDWGYGYKELTEEIIKRTDKVFVVDQSRIKPSYMYIAYYLKYSPLKYQQETESNKPIDYYNDLDFNPNYKFFNVINRNINWTTDICSNYVLVGDEYAISEKQAIEHNLSKIFEIKDPVGRIIFQGYEVNSLKKCNNN